jgi:hypothetical protein
MTPNIGKYKAILDRQLSYYSRFNIVMIGYLFFKETGWSWWFMLAIPVAIVWLYIDLNIMPSEFNYLNRKNPGFNQLLENTKRP